ncbi:hypothetical protein ABIA32_002813 [Streptacidiphilus sp. MAP12-20]|uniref:glycosyltransferase family 39 protein n=1 Tax=Streptacidiphilus sp. MAP12-20 TaxID=3156299 RepID=UPI00351257ED
MTPRLAWARIAPPLLLAATVLLATAGRYGYHRDELYFLVASRHLAFGYDDQPPLVPLIIRLETAIGGDSVQVIRVAPMLFALGLILLAALCARELAGDDPIRSRRAQGLAALATACSLLVLFGGHLFVTSTPDFFFWTLILWLVLRYLRTRDDRLWYAIGAAAGVGTLNNNLIAVLALALLLAAPLTGQTQLLRRRAVWGGVALALVIASPDLIWQATHGLPEFRMARHISSWDERIQLIPFQLETGTALSWVWIVGWFRLRADQRYRLFAFAYLLTLALVLVTGGKRYYPAGWYPLLLAAGSVWLADQWPRWRTTFVVTAVIGALVALVTGPPVLPISVYRHLTGLNGENAETIGWPRFTDTVATVYRAHPGATLLAENYGEAGALARYGPALGLPTAYADHNGYARFGHPTGVSATTVAVGFKPGVLDRYWSSCVVIARIDNGVGVANQEQRRTVQVCTGQREPWEQIWPAMLRYS